ncbi:MAG: hypothetical protein GY906_11205 [bacterium]|nr:hypothetical protein [bacterium]
MTKAPKMKVDVLGRIRNTNVPYGHAFIPLFEAVVNSIDATGDRFQDDVPSKGKVEIRIERIAGTSSLPGMSGRPPVDPIESITVIDNGCGFTDANLESFATADSTSKADRGGKGVGRFSWLVVFDEARIDSTVQVHDGKRARRTFRFVPTEKGIEDYKEDPAVAPVSTSITLTYVQKRYSEGLRMGADAIADRVFEHCFNYFVLGNCPNITLFDNGQDAPVTININERMQEVVCDSPTGLEIGSHRLDVLHVQRKHMTGRKHQAHLCANKRVVESFGLVDHSALNAEPYHSESGESVVHQAFVSGAALDEAVDSTRTRLDLPDGSPIDELAGALDLKTLRAELGAHIDNRLADILQREQEENFKRVEQHIRTTQPEYRHLIKHRSEALGRLRWSSDEAKIDERLYRVQQDWDSEVRRRQRSIEDKLTSEDADPDDLADELANIIAEVNEQGQSNLVRYVAKRRAVLNLLGRLISVTTGPAIEDRVHRVVFPLRKTADDITYDDHNLWLMDDTLSFYEFIASDKQFSQLDEAPSDSKRRPDLLAFKTGDPYQHVAIVEFKRPDRDDENPVQQLVDYAILLRDGGARNAQNVTMTGVPQSVRIDAYAVCTLTPKMEQAMRRGPCNMRKVPEEGRWFGAKPEENLWIEVLDFTAFIRRAQQRNRAFFTKLGLS